MKNITFTSDIRSILNQVLSDFRPEEIFLLTDPTTRRLCLPLLDRTKFRDDHILTIESGETYKSIESVIYIWNALSRKGARRNSVLVNLGGGLITDAGGFAASCFKRGIGCINIPTTLLSQVDASVGGKTGINFNGLKNEIGTFSLPRQVLIDTVFLETLPFSEFLSGFGEMIKHALLAGGTHFESILSLHPRQTDRKKFAKLLEASVRIKYDIVQQDPQETGVRKALNFGHTAGHALESAALAAGSPLSHGTAVAYGIIAELFLSVEKSGFDSGIYEKTVRFIRQIYPPYTAVADTDSLYELMLHDKKNDRDGVNFTLLQAPGYFITDNYCSKEEIKKALDILKA